MRRFHIYTVVFAIGAVTYSVAEILWRGHTHISMALTGGVCLAVMFFFDRRLHGLTFISKCILSAFFITVTEFGVGCIVNLWLGLSVWDYSDRVMNIMGQICPMFTFLWFLISVPALGICAGMKKFIDNGEQNG